MATSSMWTPRIRRAWSATGGLADTATACSARRSVYERYGGFDLSYRLQSDFDLTMRLMEVHRIRCHYMPRVLTRMRVGGATNNSVLNVIKGNLEAYRACRKHATGIVTPLFLVRKVLSRVPQFFARPPEQLDAPRDPKRQP